ncbi:MULTISPECIES: hypothetical protein [unclassified Mucilaginibacter]|uniref:hypothetical protein n=1 Tax=unclassified Mucilaginibacter TaxID=2617802 RepID=UPI002AC973ED|nr:MULTISPECIES: hypothetical protein [unclassified Mucilaginibacter]MEB0261367.1 hypothetical protein [Mucilaginibacter sp. 10I4]MEB0278874.1 hypothetical protein [Mucilaginibacter sp. 10B2]MEB0299760.1 hypothetical protein [Mucilaginibacter sp. 5C4]WPX22056.1 hypothetical protein RHM67_12275 [Mucilaginibacter sp. 5C4]
MENNKKLIKYILIGSSFLLIAMALNKWADFKQRNYEFKGVIEKISFNEKKTPTITVNHSEYALGSGWRFNEKLGVGDSILKAKNSLIYTLIKKKTGEIVLSE